MRHSAPTHSPTHVRTETAASYPSVDAVNRSAFGGGEEVALTVGVLDDRTATVRYPAAFGLDNR